MESRSNTSATSKTPRERIEVGRNNVSIRANARVISYLRYSSRKQSKGHSVERQLERAREWCADYGLELTESFADLGVSGYSGKNSTEGALSGLLRDIQEGKIPRGTVLIVEAFDRITRQRISVAVNLLTSIVEAGVIVVTLIDNMVWTRKSLANVGNFFMSIATLYRGFDESSRKSDLLRKKFAAGRASGSTQLFGSAPGWLSRESKTSPWVVDQAKAAVVKKVFELAAEGLGSKAISAKANKEKWVVPTRLARQEEGWHGQMPGRLLRMRAVLGEHTHRIRTHDAHAQHWEGVPTGEPIPAYYPRIISDELWTAARAAVALRGTAKRTDKHYFNIFSGLIFCGSCGAPVWRKREEKGHSLGQLSCSHSVHGKTSCKTMAVRQFDPPVLQGIYELSHAELAPQADTLGSEITAAKADFDALNSQLDGLIDLAAATGRHVPTLAAKINTLQGQIDALALKIEELRGRQIDETPGGFFDETFVREAIENAFEISDEARDRRAKLSLQLARVIDAVWLFAYDLAVVKLKNGQGTGIYLPSKRLPTRSKSGIPRPKPEAPHPHWEAYLSGTLELPAPKRSVAKSKKPLLPELLNDEDDDFGDDDDF